MKVPCNALRTDLKGLCIESLTMSASVYVRSDTVMVGSTYIGQVDSVDRVNRVLATMITEVFESHITQLTSMHKRNAFDVRSQEHL